MAGLYNNSIRDYCGDESAISKLSNHFSKDYSLKQEGLNEHIIPTLQQSIPTTFNLNELFKNVFENSTNTSNNNCEQINHTAAVSNNNNNENLSISNERIERTVDPVYVPPTYFNIPQPTFFPPEHSLVAHEWARNELSQFDHLIITEDELNALSQSNVDHQSQLRFSDVIRDMALEDEGKEISMSNDGTKQANDDFLYNLDEDLRNMRDKLNVNDESLNIWPELNLNSDYVFKEFVFIKDNHYVESLKNENENKNEKVDQLLNMGIKLYQEGYFSEAMLIFEAVVQSKPESEIGWHYLALSLSENEQDNRAMIACKKCLKINKDDREILLSLARIHCNEMNIVSTIKCLEQWLMSNPKYSDLATVGQEALLNAGDSDEIMWQNIFEESFDSSGKFGIIEQQLNSAKERNGSAIDPDIEIALGTLYHVIQDYSKSSNHFENAATVTTNNALLWNKLGTSYCNSGSFDKAISTYQKALELAPGFVRAQCNLGVSFYNMGNYRDAIKHALRAHKLQHVSMSSGKQSSLRLTEQPDSIVESDPIWSLIRMSCFKMDRPDLDLVVFSRDVDTLSKEFDT